MSATQNGTALADELIQVMRRPLPHISVGQIGSRPRPLLGALGLAAVLGAIGGFDPDFIHGRYYVDARRYPKGPCKVCGKKNVKAGSERGVYLCKEHLEAEEQEQTITKQRE